MVDPERVRRRLREIDRRLEVLRQIKAEGPEQLRDDFRVRAETEHHLQVAIQAAIDVANHIVSEDSAWTPEDYGSTFTLLAQMGVIDRQLAERLKRAAGLRNVIVHGYVDVDVDLLWEGLARAGDLEELAVAANRYLEEHRGTEPA